MSLTARVLSVADIADALLADRPYRKGMSSDEVDAILKKDCAAGTLCEDSVAAMADVLSNLVEAGAIGSSTHAAQEGSARATGR